LGIANSFNPAVDESITFVLTQRPILKKMRKNHNWLTIFYLMPHG